MSVRIIIDSAVDTAREIREKMTVVPVSSAFGDEVYTDGVTIDHKMFYEKLIESDELPKTSQPSPVLFEQAYDQVCAAGEEAVVITISSRLSGTCQSAMIAAEGRGDVFVVDSRSVSIGAGILAEYALRMAEAGMGAKEIAGRIEAERDNVRVIAMLDTLEFLKRGGRISKTAAFAGGLLSIKPVICIDDGEAKILGKARGSKQGNNLLIKEIEAAGGVGFDKPLLLGYTGITDVVLRKYIEDSAALWTGKTDALEVTPIGSGVGTHVGPGAIAVAFFKG